MIYAARIYEVTSVTYRMKGRRELPLWWRCRDEGRREAVEMQEGEKSYLG